MKPNPPSVLKGYTYDKKAASRSSLLSRIFGWLCLLVIASGICVVLFLPEMRSVLPLYFLVFFVLFILYIIMKMGKRKIICSQCGQPMTILDVQWTPEQWKSVQGYDLIDGFMGADGNLYNMDIEKQAGSAHYAIHSHSQRWVACHSCRLHFLKERYMREMLFTTVRKNEFEDAKRSLLSDPKAREKMKKAYEERLHGKTISTV